MDREGFTSMMGTIAEAWNTGESRTALDPFTDDAHHVEPPDDRGTRTYHGITLVRLENDKIADWREYQYPSELDWEAFSAGNRS